ncbi:MAG: sigma-70 family RNA polymerase sigma factor [Candidatus Altimarinota bacterium]
MLTRDIERAKKGESDAFATLYDATYDQIYRYIFHRVLDTIHTEDIISIVYEKALKGIKKFRGTSENELYSWLYQISYTSIIDYSRGSHDIESLEEVTWEPVYHEEKGNTLDNKEKLEEVLLYLKTLSEKERSIITMRIWDDMDYSEIAKITGDSEANLRKITSRTLAKIASNVSPLAFVSFILIHVWK